MPVDDSIKSLCDKHCEAVQRLALGGQLFGVPAETIVLMLKDVDQVARVEAQLKVIERIVRGESVDTIFASVREDAARLTARLAAEKAASG